MKPAAKTGVVAAVVSSQMQIQADTGNNIELTGIVLGGAHLVEAAYDAFDEEPDNEQCIETMEQGLPNCTILDALIPLDAEDYMIATANKTNSLRAEHSHMDLYADVDRIEERMAHGPYALNPLPGWMCWVVPVAAGGRRSVGCGG